MTVHQAKRIAPLSSRDPGDRMRGPIPTQTAPRVYASTDCRLNVDGDDGALLRQLAAADVRNITDQVRWLIREEVARRAQ